MANSNPPVRGVAFDLYGFISKTDGTVIANPGGLACRLCKDGSGGANENGAGAVTVSDTTGGTIKVALTATDMTADCVTVKITSTDSGAIPFVATIYTSGQTLNDIYQSAATAATGALTASDVTGIRARLNLNGAAVTGVVPDTDLLDGTTNVYVIPTGENVGNMVLGAYDQVFGTTFNEEIKRIENGQAVTARNAYRAAIIVASGDFMSPQGLSTGSAGGDPVAEITPPNFSVTVEEVVPGQHMAVGQNMLIGVDSIGEGSLDPGWQFEITHDGNDYVVFFPLEYRSSVSWGGGIIFVEGADDGSPIPAMKVTITPDAGVRIGDKPLIINFPTLPLGMAASHYVDSRGNLVGYGAGRYSPMYLAPTVQEMIDGDISTESEPGAIELKAGTRVDGTSWTS